jgi:hypothetical protein
MPESDDAPFHSLVDPNSANGFPPSGGGSGGFAFSLEPGGEAFVPRYGVAYAVRGGKASAGASGVAVTREAGVSFSGDGGVSVAHHAGSASCGAHGVAVAISAGEKPGRVKGKAHATLVLRWIANGTEYSKTARVGEEVDGIRIEPHVWYTLDRINYRWLAIPD